MDIKELIALASIRSKKTQARLAEEMGHAGRTRLSKIASGIAKADASEIVYLANAARLPELETLAEIEGERHPELAAVWAQVVSRNRGTSPVM